MKVLAADGAGRERRAATAATAVGPTAAATEGRGSAPLGAPATAAAAEGEDGLTLSLHLNAGSCLLEKKSKSVETKFWAA